MDKIHVSDSALFGATSAINKLNDTVTRLTDSCITELSALLGDLESTFSADINRYIAAARSFKIKVNDCISDNVSAIEHRRRALADYASITYKKRDIAT